LIIINKINYSPIKEHVDLDLVMDNTMLKTTLENEYLDQKYKLSQ
jgi:hypothetical protein